MSSTQTATTPGAARAAPVTAMIGTGRLYFWQGGSLWIGEGIGRTQGHRHHVASAVALSESRFRHLFVAGTGTSFRACL